MNHFNQSNHTLISQAEMYTAEDVRELQTLRDFLRLAVSRFNRADLFLGHGLPTAFDEAAHLILHTLDLSPDQLELFMDAALLCSEREQILQIVERRISERIPAAYLTHEAWLGDFSFYVDKRVIIPRSFIAELLEDRLMPWITEPEAINSVLDLCTGSGCLAVLLAQAFVHAQVDAADISADALAVAAKNVANYDLSERITLVQTDLFSALPAKQYELIVSNPPYVNAESMAALPEEYRHEPEVALAGGIDGLDFVHRILQDASRYLTADGLLIMEIGHNRAVFERTFPQLPCTWLETSAGDEFVVLINAGDLPPRECVLS